MERGETDAAFTHFKGALASNPENLVALFGLVRLANVEERLAEVVPYLRDYLSLDPLKHEVRYTLAGCLVNLGRHAGKPLARHVANGGDGPVHRGIGRHLGQKQDFVGGKEQDAPDGLGHGVGILEKTRQGIVEAAAQAQTAVDQLRGEPLVAGIEGAGGEHGVQGGLDVPAGALLRQGQVQGGQGRLAGRGQAGAAAHSGVPVTTCQLREAGAAGKTGASAAPLTRKWRKAASRRGRGTRVSRQGPLGRSFKTP